MSKFSALILTAAPPGSGGETGGPLVKLDGREALLRSVELFMNRENIPQIHVVCSHEQEDEVKRKFGGALGFMGVKLVIGGKKWQEQLAASGAKVAADATHVLVHDAARPLVPYSDLDALLEAAGKHPAVALAAALKTMLIELDEAGAPMGQHLPASFMQLLAPQVFARQRFIELAAGRDVHPSELTLVKGSPANLRLGGPGDAALAKAMLNLLPKPKSKAPSNPFEEAQW